jgi:hypothetical protein
MNYTYRSTLPLADAGHFLRRLSGVWPALCLGAAVAACGTAPPPVCPASAASGEAQGVQVLHLESPVFIPPNTDLGGYRFTCQALDGPAAASPLLSCQMSSYCDVSYEASRLEVSPSGYQWLPDTIRVERTLDLSRPRPVRLVVDIRGERLRARLTEGSRDLLRVDGFLSGAGGSEGGVGQDFVGVLRTPDAPATPMAAVSLAGQADQPRRVVESFRGAVRCTLWTEFLE